MPYKSKSELPDNVQNVLPAHAQDIYKEAFNSAWDQYKDKEDRRDDASREETAHKVAWAAVKNDYEKGDDDKWHLVLLRNRFCGRLNNVRRRLRQRWPAARMMARSGFLVTAR